MAILRAGPFGSQSGFGSMHQDEPPSATFDPLPINCALVDWTNDGWRAVKGKQENGGTAAYSYITSPTASDSFSGTTDRNSLSFSFLYQATVATSLSLDYEATSTGFGPDAFVRASVDGVSVLFEREQGILDETVSVSGSTTIDMPIAIRPILVSIVSVGSLAGSGSLSIAP